jgi:hypothetical protein
MDWIKLGSMVGVPGLIACYLVWTFTGDVKADVKDIKANVAEHMMMSNEREAHHIRVEDELGTILKRICINTAKNYQERNQCF